MRTTLTIAATAILIALGLPAAAQTGANPLQPKPAVTAPATTAPAAKPKRARSEAQLKNDNRLRTCGAEWRANKTKLSADGYNWIKYSTECRKRLAAQGQ